MGGLTERKSMPRTVGVSRMKDADKRMPLVVGGGLVVLALLAIAWWSRREAAGEQPPRPRLWPAFTLTYQIRDIEPVSGALVTDQKWKVSAEDAYTWRADLLSDALNPRSEGSYRELRDGVYTQFDAVFGRTRRDEAFGKNAVTPITDELNPNLIFYLLEGRDGRNERGWVRSSTAAPGRVVYAVTRQMDCQPPPELPARSGALPTPPPGENHSLSRPGQGPGPLACTAGNPAKVTVEQRVEFAEATVDFKTGMGIAIFGETRINGTVVHSYVVETLSVR